MPDEAARDASSRVREVMTEVHREDFLPAQQHGFGREDRALPIGHQQTNSQPSTVAAMLELLDVRPGHRVLDVGSGSGWTTAVLGKLVGPTGAVYGVEIVPELVEFGGANVAKYQMPWAEVHQAARDLLGMPDRAPFDRILVSAEASELPHALVDQLREGGVLVVPVAGRMTTVRRAPGGGPPRVAEHGHYAFVPLIRPGR